MALLVADDLGGNVTPEQKCSLLVEAEEFPHGVSAFGGSFGIMGKLLLYSFCR